MVQFSHITPDLIQKLYALQRETEKHTHTCGICGKTAECENERFGFMCRINIMSMCDCPVPNVRSIRIPL